MGQRLLHYFAEKLTVSANFCWRQPLLYERAMPGPPHDTLPLAALSPQERARALERYRILQPCVEHHVPLTHVAHDHGIPLRTAQRWLAQYRREGLARLGRRRRSDRRQPRGWH